MVQMKFNKEELFNRFELHLFSQIKQGDNVIAETEFACPNDLRDTVWRLLSNGQMDVKQVNLLYDIAEEFDLELEDGMVLRLTNNSKKEKEVVDYGSFGAEAISNSKKVEVKSKNGESK
jgi:hypothetical protein